jgi:hypothetical protein
MKYTHFTTELCNQKLMSLVSLTTYSEQPEETVLVGVTS